MMKQIDYINFIYLFIYLFSFPCEQWNNIAFKQNQLHSRDKDEH